jgi:hypothetical protein
MYKIDKKRPFAGGFKNPAVWEKIKISQQFMFINKARGHDPCKNKRYPWENGKIIQGIKTGISYSKWH